MIERILITGASGFIGSALQESFKDTDEIYLTSRTIPADAPNNYRTCNLSDHKAVSALISEIKPQRIYHMAGIITNDFDQVLEGNVLTTKNILDAVAAVDLECRVLLLGSASEYGVVEKQDNPISESHPLRPVSFYGLSKLYQTALMEWYFRMHGLDIVVARIFNVTGKGASPTLFTGRLEREVELYKKGEISQITMGNLESVRDYISSEEAIDACRLIMDMGVAGEIYNVGSGKGIQMRDLLYMMLDAEHIPREKVIERAFTTAGKLDIPEIYADITKLKKLQS